MIDPWDPRSRNEDYQEYLRSLERRAEVLAPKTTLPGADTTVAFEVWQMSTRVFLTRASQSEWDSSGTLDADIDDAFERIHRFTSCPHFFPLFILACEARTDQRREAIIGLIDRTERSIRARSLEGLRAAIHSVWVQQDLHADNDLLENYLGIMSSVIGSSNALTTFA